MPTIRPGPRALRGLAALAAVAAATAFATPGHAQARLDTPDPRYQMKETGDGYLRLDNETGAVSHCRRISADWSCTITPDERRTLEAELRTLREEQQELQIENKRLRTFLRDLAIRADRAAAAPGRLPAGSGASTDASQEEQPTARAPSATDRDGDGDFAEEAKRDIDQALDVTDYALRRLFGTFRDLEDEFTGER